MSVELKEPILVIGIGGVGSKLAEEAKKTLDSEYLTISNDSTDFSADEESIHISTKSIINPSVQLIRGSTYEAENTIKSQITGYSTIILISNFSRKKQVQQWLLQYQICAKNLEKL